MSHLVTGSGYLNSPVRTLLIADDNRPGSYPVQISPQIASKSGQYTKPYRDNVMPDTPVVYARAKVIFSGIPGSTETITLTNAASVSHTFTFRTNNVAFNAGPNSYNVSLFALSSTATQYDAGLTAGQVLVKRAAERFISAVNSATGSLITASSTDKFNVVMLTQNIPGTAGNTTNSYVTDGEFVVENFTGGNSGTVRYPFGISIGSAGEVLDRVLSTDASGTLDVPTSGKAGLLSAYSDQHPYGVFQPYDESSAHQAFGVHTGGARRHGTQARLSDEFFTRGSVSGSLDEPLWVKDKIVIDLSPVTSTSIQHRANGSSVTFSSPFDSRGTTQIPGNYPMMYFNHATKIWERIGFGVSHVSASGVTPSTLKEWLDSHYIGFGQGYLNRSNKNQYVVSVYDDSLRSTYTISKRHFRNGWCTPIDTFGFPIHPKYHATSSQALPASTLISEPFLVEKMVYEFEAASMEFPAAGMTGFFSDNERLLLSTGGTFFILRQRKGNPENDYTTFNVAADSVFGSAFYPPPLSGSAREKVVKYDANIPQSLALSPGSSPTYVDTVRDIVTFGRVGAILPFGNYEYQFDILSDLNQGFPHPALYMDLPVEIEGGGEFTRRKLTLASDIKAPALSPGVSVHITNNSGEYFSSTGFVNIYTGKNSSTRNAIDTPTGRANNAEFISSKLLYKSTNLGNPASPDPEDEWTSTYTLDKDAVPSPYLIRPEDHLIFGWQSLIGEGSGPSYVGPDFTIYPGAGKLVLYGSYLRDSKPVHDIYKDHLNSDAIHEALPTGPWVLDRFESEPQMMYSSSMREEHVTGTMVTRGAGGSLVVTDVNDLGIGGVRAVSARVSDGTVGARWSFFRNNRLFDEEEQYYDSMQPNPIKVLFDVPNTRGNLPRMYRHEFVASTLRRYIPILLPGDTNIAFTGYEDYGNDIFIGSYPFESLYSGIERVKKIDSKNIQAEERLSYRYAGVDVSLATLETILFAGDQKSRSYVFSKYGLRSSPAGYLLQISIDDTNIPRGINENIQDSVLSGVFAQGQTIDGINYHASRFMGCFGEGIYGTLFVGDQLPVDDYIVTKMLYRGVKHGLINPTPLYSSAVFNGTQFGQLRDMMEQRQYTRFSLNDNTLTDSAVDVQFINRAASPGTLNIVSGSFTNSSNISRFATSEHPYDDALSDYGQIWDRDTVLPETLIAQ